MKILITGATGMVGKNLIEHPVIAQNEILKPTRSEMDLSSKEQVETYLDTHRPDFVIHAAGRVGGIQANIKNPVAFLVDNVDINRNLIGACYKLGIKKMINLGTSCMYPRNAPNPLSEGMVLQGELEPTNEGYAIAKIMAQRLCHYIMKEDQSFHFKTMIPCNLYGRYDHFDPQNSHMIPAVIRKIHEALVNGCAEVEIWGSGEARREFMYAGDLADCVSKGLVNFETLPGVMNVGLGVDYSVNEYYQAVAEVVGYKGKFIHDLSKPVGMKQKLVSTKLAESWGWRSKVSLHSGIEKTLSYYLNLGK
ncbi:GDP-L-fucose synthase family protein [Bdellovibrio sp. HCB290]|uniref:GDP-L-fucose synthase family protein n=1 Tax=Bdellovibrio sp. HCB290 TaxID=3394356 RepID=UPI0039B37C6B